MLVNISCDCEEDITLLPLPETIPSTWLIVEKSNNSKRPTCALLVKSNGLYVTNHAQDNIHNIQILQSYHYKGHDFSTVNAPLLADWKSTGSTVLGSVGRRGFTPKPITLQAYSFGLPEPREAKVCQPWLDNNKLIDVNDPHESIGITRISTVLNQHAIVNSLKIIRCLKCHRQTPGFDIPFSELKVLQHQAYSFGLPEPRRAKVCQP